MFDIIIKIVEFVERVEAKIYLVNIIAKSILFTRYSVDYS